MAKRGTDEYRIEAAARMRRLRADPSYAEIHRQRERARYEKRKIEEPERLKEWGRNSAANYRARHPERAKEIDKRSRLNNADYYRNYNFKKRYGITVEVWEKIFIAQNKKCAICNGEGNKRGWALDHCHKTGAVRGILCHPCNTAIGFFADDPDRLRSAAAYLEKKELDQ